MPSHFSPPKTFFRHESTNTTNNAFPTFPISINKMLKTEVSNRLDTSVFSISTKTPKIIAFQWFLQLKKTSAAH